MAFKLTWNGFETFSDGTHTFEPGESRYFECREDIPTELMMDHRFLAESVSRDEAFPTEVVESDPDERARGSIPRFTEVPMPEGDTE